MISASTFLAVSVAQPTRMRTEVPANPLKAVRCVACSIAAGPAARIAKNTDPRTDIRLRTYKSNVHRHEISRHTRFQVGHHLNVKNFPSRLYNQITNVYPSHGVTVLINRAVVFPGRTSGIEAPCLFNCSLTSSGSNCRKV